MTSATGLTRRTFLGALAAAPLAAAPPTGAQASTAAGQSSDVLLGFMFDRGRFRRIDLPGSGNQTVLAGITNAGQIVGKAPRVNGVGFDGLVGDVRRLRRFSFPGVMATYANKANQRGQVAGSANRNTPMVGFPGTFGYLLDRGRFTRIAFRSAVYTQALGLNNQGQVVGEYLGDDGRYHGYRWERGRFTTFDGPIGSDTSITDINDRGDMVGVYVVDGGVRAFLLRRGEYTTFGALGLPITFAWDINNRGQVAGSADDGAGGGHGFLFADRVDGPVAQIDVPGAPATNVFGLDDRGRLVGISINPNATQSARPTVQAAPMRLGDALPLGLTSTKEIR